MKYSIKQIVEVSGLSENYIRKAIAKGELKATKEAIGETKVDKNWIEAEDYEEWRAKSGAHSKREDGRNKYVLYMNADEEAELQKLTEAHPFLATLVRANKKAELEAA